MSCPDILTVTIPVANVAVFKNACDAYQPCKQDHLSHDWEVLMMALRWPDKHVTEGGKGDVFNLSMVFNYCAIGDVVEELQCWLTHLWAYRMEGTAARAVFPFCNCIVTYQRDQAEDGITVYEIGSAPALRGGWQHDPDPNHCTLKTVQVPVLYVELGKDVPR